MKILIALTLIYSEAYGYTKETIKIAIIDNFKYQKFVTTKYKEYYLKGLTLALEQTKNAGLLTTYKIFQYLYITTSSHSETQNGVILP